jgi:hypothetical protein
MARRKRRRKTAPPEVSLSWRRFRDKLGGGHDDTAPEPVRARIIEHIDERGRVTIVGRRLDGGGLLTLGGQESRPMLGAMVSQVHRKRARGRVADGKRLASRSKRRRWMSG